MNPGERLEIGVSRDASPLEGQAAVISKAPARHGWQHKALSNYV